MIVDTSAIVAVALGEPDTDALKAALASSTDSRTVTTDVAAAIPPGSTSETPTVTPWRM